MSRCFPYPPPGYAGNCASNEALIWTIKLQRESEKTKSEKKKDRRKEKKQKKREDKTNGTISSEKKILNDEKMYDAEVFGKYPEVGQIKQQQSSYELMEKSSLTEEHGMPCCSSDSTENSGKKKRQSPPHLSNNTRNTGTVIRIKLNPRKKEECPTSTSSKNASLGLKIGTVDSFSHKDDVAVKNTTSKLRISPPKINAPTQLTTSSDKEKLQCPKSNAVQKLTICSNKEKFPEKAIEQGSTSKEEKKLPRPLRKFNALFENLVLPSMEIEAVNKDDDNWLFGSKKEVCQPSKRTKLCKEEVDRCGNHALSHQPKAQFLSDVDIYAMPFTVPF